MNEDLIKEYTQSIIDEIKRDADLSPEKEAELMELGLYFVPIMIDQVEVGKERYKDSKDDLIQYFMDMLTRTFLECNI